MFVCFYYLVYSLRWVGLICFERCVISSFLLLCFFRKRRKEKVKSFLNVVLAKLGFLINLRPLWIADYLFLLLH